MSPVLSLIVAATLSQAEPAREHVQLLEAALELHAAIRIAQPAPAEDDAETRSALHYDLALGATRHADEPATARPITYTLASPVFRDLL